MSIVTALAATTCLVALAPQQGMQKGPPPTRLEEFGQLDADKQAAIVKRIQRRAILDQDPLVKKVVWMAKAFASYPERIPRPYHDPDVFTNGVAPRRVMIRERNPRHRGVRAVMPSVAPLPDLHRAVHYDWGTGKVVRDPEPLTPEQVFENCLRGYLPGAGAAFAHVLQLLDSHRQHGPIAEYLEHLYADREGRVFENITLYRAWYSGEVLEMPDVDAIAFARKILYSQAYVSPIPADPRRQALYDIIGERTMDYRRYRTLHEAAAATFLRAAPPIDPTYRSLVPRLHYLFALQDGDPAATAAWMKKLQDREAFLERLDKEFRDDPMAEEMLEDRKIALVEMRLKVRGIAIEALAKSRQQ